MPLENFFGSAVPSNIFEEGSALSLGLRFTVNSTGVDCTGGRWYVGASSPGSITCKLYRNSDQLVLASGTISSPLTNQWNEVTWGGVHLGSGLDYTLAWETSNRYPATPSWTPWPVSTPSGKATTFNPGGYFSAGAAYPATVSGNGANYFCDPILSYTSSTTPVSKALDARWQVLNTVSAATDLRWQVANVVSKALDVRWAVSNTVSKAMDARWAVLSTVSAGLDTRWSVANIVSAGLDVRWVVSSGAATPVSSPLDVRWSVLNAVSAPLDVRWAVRSVVSCPLDVRWAQSSLVASPLDARWGFTSQVSRALDARWQVLNRVNSPVSLLWVTDGSTVRLIAVATADLTQHFIASPEPERIVADLVER